MTDSSFDPGFTTAAMAVTFSPAARVRAMCRVEAALASACADVGILTREVADEIASVCGDDVDDPDALLAAGWEAGTPVIALLDQLRASLSDAAATSLHSGATTQDIVDTGMVLQAREGLAVLREDLVGVCRDLRAHVMDQRDTPATGRTFLQPAVPTTVGLRFAGWLAPSVRHAAAIRRVHAALPLQLGGPTGTLEALGESAVAVQDRVGATLDLPVPDIPWHTDRTPVAELVATLAGIARTMAKIGTDLALLASGDAVRMRAGGSSTMPHKRNPIDAIRAVAAAEACVAVAATVTGGRPHELERGVGGWHAEWLAVPMTFHTCAASVEAAGRAVATLEVIAEREVEGGPTSASRAFVDRVVAACDAELPA